MFTVKATTKGLPTDFYLLKVKGTEPDKEETAVIFDVNGQELRKCFPNELDPEGPQADELRAIMGDGKLPTQPDDLIDKEAIGFVTSRRGAGGRFLPTVGLIISVEQLRNAVEKLGLEVGSATATPAPTKSTGKK